MEQYKDHLQDISAIRELMDRNSKFISLSGLSGVSAGLSALAGSAAIFCIDHFMLDDDKGLRLLFFKLVVAILVLVIALLMAVFFSLRLAKKKKLPTWNLTAQRMMIHLAVPLLAGAAFCTIQFLQSHLDWIPATTLMFYGMALMSAAKYTIKEIRFLGVCEIGLGLLCAGWYEFSLYFWAFGFGILHILYGIIIYYKYER